MNQNFADELELDLNKIAAEAEPRWADNWNFRAYLQQEVDPADIDRKVIELNKDFSQKIDCTQCGNCCKEIQPFLDDFDVTRLAAGTRQTPKQLKKNMNVDIEPGTAKLYRFKQMPCPMLKDNKCGCYDVRPKDCRQYPHLHKTDFLGGSIGTIENYGTCPIVYNVYNRLKSCFTYDANKDYIGDTDPERVFGSSFKSKT